MLAPSNFADLLGEHELDFAAADFFVELHGGENLQAHLGKKVEIVGTIEGKKIDIEHKDTKEQQEPAASGGDHNQPVVKTKEEIDVEARQMNVREVRDVAPTCVVTP